jgi:anti-sigma regulatory factor (Ser/Thr protein kinase)
MVSTVQINLAPGLQSAREARSQLTSLLGPWRSQVARDNAKLVLTEVITNAVRHAGGRTILITLTLTQDLLLAAVRDESETLPMAPGPGDTGGMGLIGRHSKRWGVHAHGRDGKTVWFEITDVDPDKRPEHELVA